MSDIVSGCNVMQHFCVSGSDAFGGYITYIDRDAATRNEKTIKYNLYNDYMGNPEKTTGLFSKDEDRLSRDEKRDIKEKFVNAQLHGSIMWQTVISFDNRWLEEQGLYQQKGDIITLDENKIQEVVRYGVTRMLHNENLDHAVWSAAIHYNTDNIHVHIAAVEENPSRAVYKSDNGTIEYKGKFKQSSIEVCKRTVVNEIIQQKDLNLLINKVIRKDIVEKARDRQMMQDSKLREKFLTLIEGLPDIPTNMMNYNTSKMSKCRIVIDEISNIYLDKYHKNDYDKLTKMIEKQGKEYRIAYGNSGGDYATGKKKELYERLGNVIIKEARNYLKAVDQKEVLNLAPNDQMETEVLKLAPGDQMETEVLKLAPDDQMETEGAKFSTFRFDSAKDEAEIKERYKKWFYEKKEAMIYFYQRKTLHPEPEMAINKLIESADQGNPIASYVLGETYSYGRNVEIDLDKSSLYFKQALYIFKQDVSIFKQQQQLQKDNGKFDLESYIQYRIGKQYLRGLGTEQDYKEAANWFEKSKSPYAYYSLGGLYYEGLGVDQNYEKAFALYSKASKEEMPHVNLALARMYKMGLGVERSELASEKEYENAFKLFMKMESKSRDDKQEYQIGSMLYDGRGCDQDKEEGIKYLELSAQQKNQYAQYKLSKIYIEKKMPGKIPQAEKWLIELAEKGNHEMAQYALGKFYGNPENDQYDINKSLHYYSMASDQGNQYAQYALGKFYGNPENEQYDINKSLHYYSMAADQGNQYAQYALGKFYGNPENEQYDINKSIHYYSMAAYQGNQYAQYALGKSYGNPENEHYDLKKSIHYYSMAADQGNQYAQYQLGKIYLSKESGVYDLSKGIEYLEKSMDKNEWAKYELGKLYLDTESEAHNSKLGMQYMKELAYKENQYAQCKLGFEYLSGKNVDRSITLSKAWFSKAAAQGNEMAAQMLGDMSESSVRTLKGLNSWGELDQALYALQKSMNEEYQQEWQNIREYEQMIRNEPEESLEID